MSPLLRSISTAKRLGLLDPATVAAAGAAAVMWGPELGCGLLRRFGSVAKANRSGR